MLRSLENLEHYKVSASDGDIGHVVKFLFDDQRWIIRYLVVQCGGPLFLDGRRVLISPISFREANWTTKRFHLALTRDMVKNSPSINVDKPVSRQHERDYFLYYGYPRYWGSAMGAMHTAADAPTDSAATSGDIHLRSDEEVRGYHIQGSDDAIGHIEDFIVDDETWEIRYLVVDTRIWWFGKNVLIAPKWARRISWKSSKVYVDLSRQAIKDSPEWKPSTAIDRAYAERLYDYYWTPGKRRHHIAEPNQEKSFRGPPKDGHE